MQGFRPSPPRDLLSPRPDSTTARALVSLVRRTRFEAWKAYAPEGLPAELEADLRSLRAVLSHFLPGNPHAVSHVLSLPGVGASLRRAVGGALRLDGTRAAPDPSAIAELCTSALLALHVEGALPFEVTLRAPVDVTIPARDVALRVTEREVRFGSDGAFGATLTSAGVARFRVGVWLSSWPKGTHVDVDAPEDSPVGAAERALTELESHLPGRIAELRRVALEVVGADAPEDGFARRFGRLVIAEPTPRAFEVERVRHLLSALSEVDDLAGDPAPLVAAALARAAGERPAGVLDDALDHALRRCEPTDVGRGLLTELCAEA